MDRITLEPGLDDRIARVVMILMAIGTLFVFSAWASLSHELDLKRFYEYPGMRQVLYFPLAVLVMLGISRVNYHCLGFDKGLWRSPTTYLLGLSVVLLILVLIPQFGTKVNEARRWFRIGPLSFQPSELAKWALLFFLAATCARYQLKIDSFGRQFVPICVVVGAVVGLILIEDFGTAAFLALLAFLMLAVGGARGLFLLSPLPFAIGGFLAALLLSPYRLQRLMAFRDPEKFADSAAYQARQSLVALGSGGLFGKGLGNGICKYDHLPEDTTDFVFSIIGEELGLVGTLAVIGLFILFVWLGILVITRCKDPFGRLLATGIVLAISVQAAFNIGVVTVVLPTKGIPLPFISGGGTSLLVSAAAVGVLLNVAREASREVRDEAIPSSPPSDPVTVH